MKILFLAQGDHNDIQLWSGTVYYLSKTLEDLGHEIVYLDNLDANKLVKLIAKLRKVNSKDSYDINRNKLILKNISKKIEKQLNLEQYDLIFSPSTLPITYLDTKVPIIAFTDATFNSMVNYYDGFKNLSKLCIQEGNEHEKLALDKCNKIIYSSEWAKKSAVEYYGIDEDKISVINFGANIKSNYDLNTIEKIIENKINNNLELLFIGVDWERKGGDIVLKTLKNLKDNNVDVNLNIVGCNPTIPKELKDNVTIYGFLNKSKNEDLRIITDLFEKSHFLFLPTRQEAFGIVYAEASSYALPSIATSTGGVTSAIKHGCNGFCLPIDSDEEDYSKLIIDIFEDKKIYEELCKKSYQEYLTRLNWNYAGLRIQQIINDL